MFTSHLFIKVPALTLRWFWVTFQRTKIVLTRSFQR